MAATTEKKSKAVEVNPMNVKRALDSCGVKDYPLAKIRAALDCTWLEASELRHAAPKADKK
jgi:hypothetical protein